MITPRYIGGFFNTRADLKNAVSAIRTNKSHVRAFCNPKLGPFVHPTASPSAHIGGFTSRIRHAFCRAKRILRSANGRIKNHRHYARHHYAVTRAQTTRFSPFFFPPISTFAVLGTDEISLKPCRSRRCRVFSPLVFFGPSTSIHRFVIGRPAPRVLQNLRAPGRRAAVIRVLHNPRSVSCSVYCVTFVNRRAVSSIRR